MKKYIVLGLLMTFALSVSARMYPEGDVIFVNVQQADGIGNWAKDNAKLFAYLYQESNSSNNVWIRLNPIKSGSTIYYGTMPSGKAPWFDKAQIIRQSPSGEEWNKSGVMDIPDDARWNCIFNFYDGGNRWKLYTPDASSISSFITETAEVISVCDSAAGAPISLRPKLKIEGGEKVGYQYENVYGYAWYKSENGTTWVGEKSYAGSYRNAGDENIEDKDLFETLPNPIPAGGIYYYLFSTLTKGRRLVHVLPNATDCELDCKITAFETAISAVNADDSTYTLDGMVAFGKPNGNLIIECDGKSLVIASDTIHSPQSFSLHGVPAATTDGQKTTAYAYFTGDINACRESVTVNVPNATQAVDKITMDSLTGKQFVLTPIDIETSNQYVWMVKNEATGQLDTLKGASQVLTVDAFSVDTALTLVYKEYYPGAGNMDDLMDNGGYENNESEFDYGTKGKKSTISEYNYWGYYDQTKDTQINFYTDTCPSCINPTKLRDNGFAVVRNSNNFYPTYAKVTALEGNNFGLFDAVSGKRGGNKRAWEATTAKNSKLKLKKGTTYVLSFWAANINNYGEMDNAAKFRFYIEDISNIDNPVRLDSSQMLDLSQPEYHNNLWHQCSKTFTAKKDYNNVRISVVNKNLDTLHIGNDFALDDIQFHPISSVSKVVKSQQEFRIYAHEPKIDAFTATVQPVSCDETDYTIAMHVEYQNNPAGQLYIRDVTRDTIYKYDLPALVAFDTPYMFNQNIVIKTKEPMHTLEAYFENWTTAKKDATTDIPGFPSIDTLNVAFSEPTCAETTTALTFTLNYTYQQGQLHYTITELIGDSTAVTTVSKAKQTLAGLRFEGIPADGKVRHLRIWWDGANSCDSTFTLPAAPFSPVIDAVKITSAVPTIVTCATDFYTVDVNVTLHNDPTGFGKNIHLNYHNGVESKDTIVAATGKTTSITGLKLYNMDATDLQTIYADLAGHTPACQDSVKYNAPKVARITPNFDVTVGETACDTLKYALTGTVYFDMPDGNLVVEYDATHRDVITVTAGSTSADFTITGMTAAGTGLGLKAWFENSATTACTVDSKPFDAPVVPTIDTANIAFSAPGCNDLTTTLTFDLGYTYQQGTLSYWVDGLAPQTAGFMPKEKTAQTLTGLTVEGIPADGKNDHVLHVSFSGDNSCKEDFVLPAVPFSPVIDDVTVTGVPKTVPCGITDYTIGVNFSAHYTPIPADKEIVLTYDSLCDTKTITSLALTDFPYNLTIHNIANGIHSVFVAFEDTPDCKKEIQYITPGRDICDTVTICEGESYDWHEQSCSGSVGEHKIPDGTDTLYLFVKEKPTITIGTIAMTCDDANVVRIPFSVVKGQPDSIGVAIGDSHFTATLDIVGTDTAFTFAPAAMKAGDYAAQVTVGETDVPCTTTVDINFTIALSDYVYSKWTDVLFVSNKEGLFTAYQWFADGAAMSGETLQRLYDPKGLSGSNIVYYCQLTTTDGKTLYTCPQTFDDVTPSRTVDTTPAKVKATTLYDSMGRVIKTTPHYGIYIVVEELENGEIRTRKITVYE